jgi:CheY-like chemotaxis protein
MTSELYLPPWRILVVDDEEGIHGITRMIFRDYAFEGRLVELISALSGRQARELLRQHEDIALILLDVVMESDDEGLRLVDYIRDELGNRQIRIILRNYLTAVMIRDQMTEIQVLITCILFQEKLMEIPSCMVS